MGFVREYTIKKRLWQAVLEVLVGSCCLLLLFLLTSYALVATRQLVTAGNEVSISLGDRASARTVLSEMEKTGYDFTVWDKKSGQLKAGIYQKEDERYFKRSFESQADQQEGSVHFRFAENASLAVVVRQPSLPEFVNPAWRKIPYNQFSYLFFVTGEILILFVILARLLREFAQEFHQVQTISLHLGEKKAPPATSRIKEFQSILTMLYQKDRELYDLVERERLEKEDLSFQVAALSHDVKTPLTVLKGNIELLEMTDLTERQQAFLSSMENSVETFEKYFQEMLIYSQLIREERDYSETIPVAHFLKTLELDSQELLERAGLGFRAENHLSETQFSGNQRTLERALLNILLNASRYAQKEISLTLEEETDKIVFHVWNDGPPFSEKVLSKADTLFFTEDTSRTGKHYGIGLSFAKAIAQGHQGKLVLQNLEQGGAEVILWIKK